MTRQHTVMKANHSGLGIRESARALSYQGPPLDPLGGPEHRDFPRAKLEIPFRLQVGDEGDVRFQATLLSANVSVSGAFLHSTFFLPVGTFVRASFCLEASKEAVLARAQVLRTETVGRDGRGRSGFSIRFVEFFEQTEVMLARLFLEARLRAFAEHYLASRRAKSLPNEVDRCVDTLAAWELRKVNTGEDPWAASS